MDLSQTRGELWGVAAYEWATLQEPLHRPLWEAMLKASKAGLRTRLLDAGCGCGCASDLAVQRGADVKGLDAAKRLICIARQRAPPAELGVGDLEALPYETEELDLISASLSVQYAAAPVAALSK